MIAIPVISRFGATHHAYRKTARQFTGNALTATRRPSAPHYRGRLRPRRPSHRLYAGRAQDPLYRRRYRCRPGGPRAPGWLSGLLWRCRQPGVPESCGLADAGHRHHHGQAGPRRRRRRIARAERGDLKIIARARDERHAMGLYAAGVTEAVPETIESSLQLGEAVLVEAACPWASPSPPFTNAATPSGSCWIAQTAARRRGMERERCGARRRLLVQRP